MKTLVATPDPDEPDHRATQCVWCYTVTATTSTAAAFTINWTTTTTIDSYWRNGV